MAEPTPHEVVDLLLALAGEVTSYLIGHRLTAAALTNMARLADLVESSEAHRSVLEALLRTSDGRGVLLSVKLDKYLRGRTYREVDGDRARGLGGRLLRVLHGLNPDVQLEAYIYSSRRTSLAEALRIARGILSKVAAADTEASPTGEPAAGAATGSSTVAGDADVQQLPPACSVAAAPPPLPSIPFIVWVDDNHSNHRMLIEAAQDADVHVVELSSVEQAHAYLRAYARTLARRGPGAFRIVTDMHQAAPSGEAHDAGFRLWDIVRRELYLTRTPILIFTSEHGVEAARRMLDGMASRQLQDSWIRVTDDPVPCGCFVTFQSLADTKLPVLSIDAGAPAPR